MTTEVMKDFRDELELVDEFRYIVRHSDQQEFLAVAAHGVGGEPSLVVE